MPSDDALTGRVLGDRYEIVDVLGRGGMASVYRAKDLRLDRFVAAKIFGSDVASADDDDRRRAEVDALAKLNHPNLVTLHDAHLDPAEAGQSYLIMELVDGPDLRTTLDHGPLLGEIVAAVATDIAEALVTVHSLGLVHRDVKPANILLQPTGLPSPRFRAKLADFGIAHLLGADRLTAVGTVVGTAAYLSPEQATGIAIGPPADIYALALVILESLTGRRVYPGTVVEAMTARAALDPQIPDDLPGDWVTLLTWMTARSPEDRPTAIQVAVRSREIGAQLAGWAVPASSEEADDATQAMLAPTKVLSVGGQPVTRSTTVMAASPPVTVLPAKSADSGPTPMPRDRNRRLAAIVAVAVLVLAIGTALLVVRMEADESQATPSTPTSASPSPSPSVTPSITPSPVPSASVVSSVAPVAPAPPQPGNGNGNGKDKGNGKVKNK